MRYKASLIAALIALGSLPALAAKAPEVERQSFDLNGIDDLTLALHHGRVTLAAAADPGGQIRLELEQRLRRGDPEHCLYRLTEQRSGDRLSVSAFPEEKTLNAKCSVDRAYRVWLDPQNLEHLALVHHHTELQVGAISVPDLKLDLRHTQAELGSLAGERVEIDLSHGGGWVDSVTADQFTVDGAHASFVIRDAKAHSAQAEWAHGRIELERSRIEEFAIETGHGATRLKDHAGETLRAQTQHGPLRIEGNLSHWLKLKGAHGDMRFEGSAPDVAVDGAHSDTRLTQTLTDRPFHISGEARHGDITVTLPEGVAYESHINDRRSTGGATGVGERSSVTLDIQHGEARVVTN